MFAYLLTEIASCKMNGMGEIDENNKSNNNVCCEIGRGLVLSFGFDYVCVRKRVELG